MRLLIFLMCVAMLLPQTQQTAPTETDYLLKPARVFDGESAQVHDGWAVLVHGDKIVRVGPAGSITPPAGAKVIDLPGLTLMPGLIEAHSRVFWIGLIDQAVNPQIQMSARIEWAHSRDFLRHQRGFFQAGSGHQNTEFLAT